VLFVHIQDIALRGIDPSDMDTMFGVLSRMVTNLGAADGAK